MCIRDSSACESEFELIVADVIIDLIQTEYADRLILYNQVHTCGFRLDLVVYDRATQQAVGIEVDGKHHYFADGSTYTDDHLERANSLKRAGWKIKYLPYWNWFQDGWIEKDDAAAKDLRQFVRDFFEWPIPINWQVSIGGPSTTRVDHRFSQFTSKTVWILNELWFAATN